MQCPKCHSTMEPIAMAQANVHRCEGCRGLWFEMVDHETLKDRAAELDVGDPVQGEQYNKIDRIKCPACVGHRDLIRMVDPLQPHIWFESCKGCYGRFYDAGEFRDFADDSVDDFFKQFSTKPRD